jgi:hypothetical protein
MLDPPEPLGWYTRSGMKVLGGIAPVLFVFFAACSSEQATREDVGIRPPIGTPHDDASTFDAGPSGNRDATSTDDTGLTGNADAAMGENDSGGASMNDGSTGSSSGDGGGTNTIMGTGPDGQMFNQEAVVFWIPPLPMEDRTSIYILSAPFTCADVQSSGWDARLPAGSQILWFESLGSIAKSYPIVLVPDPMVGQAVAHYEVVGGVEAGGTSGSMTISTIYPMDQVTGSYTIFFQNNQHITGTFSARWCAGGVHP